MHKTPSLRKKLQVLITIALSAGFSQFSYSADRQVRLLENGSTSTHHYSSSIVKSTKTTETIRPTTATENARATSSKHGLLWIFEAAIGFNTDHDHDGHYSNFTLTIDIDTRTAMSAVYTVLYLSLEDGPWTEYAVSDNFYIQGSGPHDSYTIEADLTSGYPSGYYDHLIEVYDADSHELLTSYGPDDAHFLHSLPFESRRHDQLFSFDSSISFNVSGTGSSDLPLLLPLLSMLFFRRALSRKKLDWKKPDA